MATVSRPYSSFDLCDNWRLSRKMPGPEASVLGSARQQRVSARSGVGRLLLWETHRSPRGSAGTSGVLSVTRQRTCKVNWWSSAEKERKGWIVSEGWKTKYPLKDMKQIISGAMSSYFYTLLFSDRICSKKVWDCFIKMLMYRDPGWENLIRTE